MEWLIPQDVCVMINVICQADEQVINTSFYGSVDMEWLIPQEVCVMINE